MPNPGLIDVDASHGQRVRKGVQECGGVGGSDIHDSVGRGLLVVEPDLHGMEKTGKGGSYLAERFDESPIHVVAGILKSVLIQKPDHAGKLVNEALLLRGCEGLPRCRPHQEAVHDLLAG